MVLEVTAKTDKGDIVVMGKREYWEIGLDLEGDHRMGAWQIKEIVDLTLPPRKKTKEHFVSEFPEGTGSAEIETRVIYNPSAKVSLELYRETKKVIFGR